MHTLAGQLFVHSATRAIEDPAQTKCGTPLLRYLRMGLMNPALTTEHLREIDARAEESPIPRFSRNTDTEHFQVRWSDDDPNANHRSTEETIDSLVRFLEEAYLVYTVGFGRAPLKTKGAPDDKIVVQVYDLPGSPEGKTTRKGVIDLDAVVMANPTQIRTVAGHELFHRIEFAFGMDRNWSASGPDAWFSEGMPDWAALFATGGWADRDFEVTWCFDNLDKPFFANIPYRGSPAWIFLEGFGDAGTGNSAWAARRFLEACEEKADPFVPPALAAFADVCRKATDSAEKDDEVVLARFYNEFTLARASKHWKMTGSRYERTEMLPGYLTLRSGKLDNAFDPKVTFTATHELLASDVTLPQVTGTIDVSAANMFKIAFDPAHDGKTAILRLRCESTSGLVWGSSAMINENDVASYQRAAARHTDPKTREISWHMPVDTDRYDFMAVALTNGHVRQGGAKIQYQLDISVA